MTDLFQPNQQATLTFPIRAGVAVRGAVKRNIKSLCFAHGLRCSVDEDKSLLSSTYYFTIKGDEEVIRMVERTISYWVEEFGS